MDAEGEEIKKNGSIRDTGEVIQRKSMCYTFHAIGSTLR